MLDDFGNVGLVLSADFSCYPFQQVHKSSIHPVLPEYTGSRTEWGRICFDHAERPMNGPENEEYDKEMVSVPEAFEITSSRLSHGRGNDEHEDAKHDVPRPARTGGKVCKQKSFETQVVLSG